jgi:hypothetical protein
VRNQDASFSSNIGISAVSAVELAHRSAGGATRDIGDAMATGSVRGRIAEAVEPLVRTGYRGTGPVNSPPPGVGSDHRGGGLAGTCGRDGPAATLARPTCTMDPGSLT